MEGFSLLNFTRDLFQAFWSTSFFFQTLNAFLGSIHCHQHFCFREREKRGNQLSQPLSFLFCRKVLFFSFPWNSGDSERFLCFDAGHLEDINTFSFTVQNSKEKELAERLVSFMLCSQGSFLFFCVCVADSKSTLTFLGRGTLTQCFFLSSKREREFWLLFFA